MASAVARAYNGGLGAEPPAGSKGRAPGQRAKPSEAESYLALKRPKKHIICHFCALANCPEIPKCFTKMELTHYAAFLLLVNKHN